MISKHTSRQTTLKQSQNSLLITHTVSARNIKENTQREMFYFELSNGLLKMVGQRVKDPFFVCLSVIETDFKDNKQKGKWIFDLLLPTKIESALKCKGII